MNTIKGPVADHYASQVRFAGPHFTPHNYKGLPFVWAGYGDVMEWIEANIDHTGLVALVTYEVSRRPMLLCGQTLKPVAVAITPSPVETHTRIFGTFASDDDAILFKMRWEGTR